MELITSHPRWGDIDLDPEQVRSRMAEHDPLSAGDAARSLLRGLCGPRGKAALGRQVPALHLEGEADPASAARGALHPPDPRRPRRRAVAERGELGPGRRPGGGSEMGRRAEQGARSGAAARARDVHGAPLRGPGRRPRAPPAADRRLRRPALGREHARLPPRRRGANEGGDPRLPPDGGRHDHRRGAQAPARAGLEPAQLEPGGPLEDRDVQPRTARHSRASPGTCSPSWATRSE